MWYGFFENGWKTSADVWCSVILLQDAHEFLQFLLNDIVEGLKKKALKQHDKEKRKQEVAATLQHDQSQEEEPRTLVRASGYLHTEHANSLHFHSETKDLGARHLRGSSG